MDIFNTSSHPIPAEPGLMWAGTESSGTVVSWNTLLLVELQRDKTIFTEAARDADFSIDWLQFWRKMLVATVYSTVVSAIPEDLVMWAAVTLFRQDTLCVVGVIAEWNEPKWTSTTLETDCITEWSLGRWEVVVFTGETTGCGTAAQDMVPQHLGFVWVINSTEVCNFITYSLQRVFLT